MCVHILCKDSISCNGRKHDAQKKKDASNETQMYTRSIMSGNARGGKDNDDDGGDDNAFGDDSNDTTTNLILGISFKEFRTQKILQEEQNCFQEITEKHILLLKTLGSISSGAINI